MKNYHYYTVGKGKYKDDTFMPNSIFRSKEPLDPKKNYYCHDIVEVLHLDKDYYAWQSCKTILKTDVLVCRHSLRLAINNIGYTVEQVVNLRDKTILSLMNDALPSINDS